MRRAFYRKYKLKFKSPGGTSRGVLHEKETYIIALQDGERIGVGECALFRGLSYDDKPDYESKLQETILKWTTEFEFTLDHLVHYPSLRFGVETALLDLQQENHILYPSAFTRGEEGIRINGLIWMGEPDFMKKQIEDKLNSGFKCLKMKIGAIDFEKEISLLQFIRQHFPADRLELRVDANGAFGEKDVLKKLDRLADFDIHSIEQPVKQQQPKLMKKVITESPIAVALDEELIGVHQQKDKHALLEELQPHYIILKPALVGGFSGSHEWIHAADEQNIGWWVTSALESNVGLSAIAQWTFTLNNSMPQGLGTGKLFHNNFESPLYLDGELLKYNPATPWFDFKSLFDE